VLGPRRAQRLAQRYADALAAGDVLTLSGEQIAAVTAFIVEHEPDPAGIFASFGLPARVA
jgi:hypothetical protein